MVWPRLAPIGKIKSGKQNTLKRYTPKSTTPIGANTMFLQIGKHLYTIYSAPPILPYITNNLSSSDGKTFYAKCKTVSFYN
jgi:hypothetical protein